NYFNKKLTIASHFDYKACYFDDKKHQSDNSIQYDMSECC
ncbi:hypothetical protein YPPY54_2217, partial [Yersinia pestis PY-54]